MAQELITSFTDFTPSNTTYGDPRTNARGGKAVKILDSKARTLILSTPLMLTWGVNKMVDEDTGRISYSLSLQFPSGEYTTDSTNMFYEKIRELQNKVLDDAVTHSKQWFNKSKMSREVAEALFYPMLKHPKDKVTGEPDVDRAPTLNVKIPYWNEEFNVELYNMDQTPLFTKQTDLGSRTFESYIPKMTNLAAILRCNGVWFAGGKFGVTWYLQQACVRPPLRLEGQCFISLTSDDNQRVSELAKIDAKQSAIADVAEELMTTTDVLDSDDEEEEEAEPTPPPKKVKRKRRVVKKKVVAEE